MAVVSQKKSDSKHAHLSKVYTQAKERIVVQEADEKVEFKKEEVKLSRSELMKDGALVLILAIVSVSGYLLFKVIS